MFMLHMFCSYFPHLAVHRLLLRAQLVQLGGQPDVPVLDGSQFGLLLPALIGQLVLVETQAQVDAAIACGGSTQQENMSSVHVSAHNRKECM